MASSSTGSVPCRCVLHTRNGVNLKNLKVLPFNPQKWKKVQVAKDERLKCHHSKYRNICNELPAHYGSDIGYHSICYKNFVAIRKSKKGQVDSKVRQEQRKSTPTNRVLRSDLGDDKVGHPDACLFCNQVRLRTNAKFAKAQACKTHSAQNLVKDAARQLDDFNLLAKIERTGEVRFHQSCKRKYCNKATRFRTSKESKHSEFSECKEIHAQAFDMLVEYITESIITPKRPQFLNSILRRYNVYVSSFGYNGSYTTTKLTKRLIDHFGDEISIGKTSNKEGCVIFTKGISKDEAVRCAVKVAKSVEHTVSEAALHLRSAIMQLQRNNATSVPHPLTSEYFSKSQVVPPDALLMFFRVLYTGSEKCQSSERVDRYIQSAAQDAIFATTRGKVKPSKHLCLGLGLKSMTGSAKVVKLMNRLGHSVSYNVVGELEDSLATSVIEKQRTTPDGLLQQPGLVSGVAWDNYDEKVDTLSGQGSMHDTVGICYQNKPTNPVAKSPNHANPTSHNSIGSNDNRPQKRKRLLDICDTQIEPYRKKPKISNFTYDITSTGEPVNLTCVKRKDTLWMVSHALLAQTPMWVGWNSALTVDTLPRQSIGYMANLNMSPTRLDVVAETMRISQKLAKECGESHVLVHYDLAIAKPALQIQSTDSPAFDNVFVGFGAFHIELAYFAVLGHMLSESGGPQVLIDTEVLASGSLNGFLSGKHYNRCKRLHPILSLAIRTLHFQSFLDSQGEVPDSFMTQLKHIHDNPSPDAYAEFERSDVFVKVMQMYEEYSEQTRSGQHGATAQYWILYSDLVQVYLLFSRATRTNDLDLFIYSLEYIGHMFFATNHPNYARYIVIYHLNLLNVDKTHPGVRKMLTSGGLSVRRSSKCFSRTAVDLTLEQTINANAASRKTGISALTANPEARRRWMITHSERSSIIGYLLDFAGLNSKEDATKELQKSRLRRDNNDLAKVKRGIEECLNPFDPKHKDDNLFCLSTGKSVSPAVKQDLLHVRELGKKYYNQFKSECLSDSSRFEKPIPRRKIKNFASDAVKVKLTTKDKKIKELQGTRDLFGRLLYLASNTNLNLSFVFKYPLTPVPLALSHIDGSLNKTTKSTLMRNLEGRIKSESPSTTDAVVVDAMFFIRSLISLPPTYGGIAKKILSLLLQFGKHVHFVCDTYKSPSIKDTEHVNRGCSPTEIDYNISGPEQKRPKDFTTALKSGKFKTSLLRFLEVEWGNSKYVDLLQGHSLTIGLDMRAFNYQVFNGGIQKQEVVSLACTHEEADTRVVWHLKHISQELQKNSNIVVRANDTDILVILLYHSRNLQAHIWLDIGTGTNNTRRYVDVTKLANNMGRELCLALPGFHSFSGSDFTAAFMNKGKITPLSVMQKYGYTSTFAKLGDGHQVADDVMSDLESYVCALYRKPKTKSVDEARFDLFEEHFAPKRRSKPFEKIKGINPSSLPPCKASLVEKIKRSHFVASVWKRATLPDTVVLDPEEYGWKLQDGHYVINWYDGQQVPDDIYEKLENLVNHDDEEDEDDIYASSCPSSDESEGSEDES